MCGYVVLLIYDASESEVDVKGEWDHKCGLVLLISMECE